MGLLDGGIAEVFGAAFGTFYLDATLHRPTDTPDGKGGGTVVYVPEAVKVQLDATTEAMRSADNYTDTDQRILVLASGVEPIDTDCEITVAATRWKIAAVSQDPARSYYELRGTSASPAAGVS